MYKFWLLFIFPLLIGISGSAKEKYPISTIPSSIKRNAKAVVRESSVRIHLEAPDSYLYQSHTAITILNENGLHLATKYIYYDKFSSVRKIKATVYDEHGNRVKKIKAGDIIDISAIDGGTHYTDNRVKIIDPKYQTYPFTIEFSYEIKDRFLLNMHTWDPIPAYSVGLEQAELMVFCAEGMSYQWKNKNLKEGPVKRTIEDQEYDLWTLQAVLPLYSENYSAAANTVFPMVNLAPIHFSTDGVQGNMSSWESLGKWSWELIKDQGSLPLELKNKVDELVRDAATDREKAKILYEYLQRKTHYVSIQDGIGGWKPMSVAEVDQLCYGDCKALTNYLKSMLDHAGIKSYYASVKAGRRASDIDIEFPSNQFNHVLLCIPFDEDTVWLECTSTANPFAYAGVFTADRHALLIKETGGELVYIPAMTASDNQYLGKTEVHFKEGEMVQVHTTYFYSGMEFEDMNNYLYEKESQIRNRIINKLPFEGVKLEHYEEEIDYSEHPSLTLKTDFQSSSFTTMIGDRVIFPLVALNYTMKIPSTRKERLHPIKISTSRIECDTFIFNIPNGMETVSLPEPKSIESCFGNYELKCWENDNKIYVIRKIEWIKGIFPKTEIESLLHFLEEVQRYDNSKSAFRKKEITSP